MSADPIDRWLQFKEHSEGCSSATSTKYRGYMLRLQKHLAADGKALHDALVEDLEGFVGLHMHKEGLSPRSRRALVAAVRGFYAWSTRHGHIKKDPSETLGYPKGGNRLPIPMSLQNAEKILMQPDLDTFIGVRDAAILATLMGCGPRISGLVRLNMSSLIFFQDDGKEHLVVKIKEKGNKERLVPAPDETRLLIRAYLGHDEIERIDRTLPDGDSVLFVGVRNRRVPDHEYHGERRRISPRSVNDMIVHYGAAAGVPRSELHPHAMRHLYGAELAEEDVDLDLRQALLGHNDPKTTQIYSHLAMRKLRKAVMQANPLRKIRTPVSDLVRVLK